MFLCFTLTSDAGYIHDGTEYQYFVQTSNGSRTISAYLTVPDGWHAFLCGTSSSNVYQLQDCEFVMVTDGETVRWHYDTDTINGVHNCYFLDTDMPNQSCCYTRSIYHDKYNFYFVTNNFPIFESHTAALNYFNNGDTSGAYFIPDPPVPEFDPYNNEYSEDIPAPEIYRDGDKIMFSNSSPDMLLLANIRWYSVDDITLFKESLSWKYRPDSIIHSDLDWLLSVDDLYSSVNGIDLYTLGNESFQKFLSSYPVDDRTYLGGTNAIGNYLFGYNDALSTLKMILGQIDSSFNAPELFFRYYVPLDDGTYKCGKWTKYSRSLPSGASDTWY